MPNEIDSVKRLEDDPGIDNPYALCTYQHQKEKRRNRREKAFRNKMKAMLK